MSKAIRSPLHDHSLCNCVVSAGFATSGVASGARPSWLFFPLVELEVEQIVHDSRKELAKGTNMSKLECVMWSNSLSRKTSRWFRLVSLREYESKTNPHSTMNISCRTNSVFVLHKFILFFPGILTQHCGCSFTTSSHRLRQGKNNKGSIKSFGCTLPATNLSRSDLSHPQIEPTSILGKHITCYRS